MAAQLVLVATNGCTVLELVQLSIDKEKVAVRLVRAHVFIVALHGRWQTILRVHEVLVRPSRDRVRRT
jgi:hypothetical protein